MAEPWDVPDGKKLKALLDRVCRVPFEPPPSNDARGLLDLLLRQVLSGGPALSREAMGERQRCDRRTISRVLEELARWGLVVLHEASGSAPARVELVWGRIDQWSRGNLVFAFGTANGGLLSGNGTADEVLPYQNGTAASRAGVTAAAVGVEDDGAAEQRLIAEECRRTLAEAGVGSLKFLFGEVLDEVRKGSTVADFRRCARELAAGPKDAKAWRTALPILARLRRERYAVDGVIEFPGVAVAR